MRRAKQEKIEIPIIPIEVKKISVQQNLCFMSSKMRGRFYFLTEKRKCLFFSANISRLTQLNSPVPGYCVTY